MAGALRRAWWRHPELGAAAAAAAAWALLLVPVAGGERVARLHAMAHRDAPVAAGALGWLTMVVAMMVPPALPAARRVGIAALWRRRSRTVTLFLAGHVAVWAAFGVVALPTVAVAERRLGVGPMALLTAALGVAAVWELTPVKWRCVRACHLIRPVPPDGRRADRASFAVGARHGARCAGACWAMMLAMAIAGHESVGLMALLTAIAVTERGALRPGPLARPAAASLAFAAAVTLVG